MKTRTKDHPHHFGKLKNDVARPSAGQHATPDLISRLEKLDRESLVSNPLSVQKVD
jgi:hypothetical protein